MMTKNADKKREQMMMFSMDDMVPQNHMLRLIDKAINWNFIYDLVEEKYCLDNGRPSMDPVMLIKIPFIQYLYGIKSMRQTIKEIEVNVAYRWFLGLDMPVSYTHLFFIHALLLCVKSDYAFIILLVILYCIYKISHISSPGAGICTSRLNRDLISIFLILTCFLV